MQVDTTDTDSVYEFTVIMAVYNTEPFLKEAIGSIITQDIGFEDHVQLILVDDGSTDHSGKICDQFQSLYPHNIFVIHKENGGVSSARNMGLEHANGTYINFMDSDDKLQSNALQKAHDFFLAHDEEVDVVSIPVQYFDGRSGVPSLNDKYADGTRVIDLLQDPTAVLMSLTYAFTKRTVFKHLRFDTHLTYGEDAQLAWKILLKKMKLGVIEDTYYFYRVRTTGESSAMQTIGKGNAKAYYLLHLKYLHLHIIDYALKTIGYIPNFIQYAILFDLKWKLEKDFAITKEVLAPQEVEEYLELFFKTTRFLSDDILLTQKPHGFFWNEYKFFLLSKKYNEPSKLVEEKKDLFITIHDHKLMALSEIRAVVSRLDIGEKAVISGYVNFLGIDISSNIGITLRVNQSYEIDCKSKPSPKYSKFCMGENIFPAFEFQSVFQLPTGAEELRIRICTYVDNVCVERKGMRDGKYFPLSTVFMNSYFTHKGYMVMIEHGDLLIRRVCKKEIDFQENKFLQELKRKNTDASRNAVTFRAIYKELNRAPHKEIWLIQGDGENRFQELFHRLQTDLKLLAIDVYYVSDEDDWEHHIVKRNSQIHFMMRIISDKIITSTLGLVGDNFNRQDVFYRDITWKQEWLLIEHDKDRIIDEDLISKNKIIVPISDNASCEDVYKSIKDRWLQNTDQRTSPGNYDELNDIILRSSICMEQERKNLIPVEEASKEMEEQFQYTPYETYIFPYHLFQRDERVVIYGAGEVGKSFYKSNKRTGLVNVVAILDTNYQKLKSFDFPVQTPDIINGLKYDSILIAVRFEPVANSIIKYLERKGVAKDKIKWDGTVYHVDDFYKNKWKNKDC